VAHVLRPPHRERCATFEAKAVEPPGRLPAMPQTGRVAEPIQRSPEEAEKDQYKLWPLLPLELRELAEPCASRFVDFVKRTQGASDLEFEQVRGDVRKFIKELAGQVAAKREQLGLEVGDSKESAEAARAKW
ncbi:POLR3A, partial [Symbiodinium pilosum]